MLAPAGVIGAMSSFAVVRAAVFSDPYTILPTYPVSARLFGPKGPGADNRLRSAARRTLSSSADLLVFPAGQKLLAANGICFSGTWRVGTDSPYTGLLGPDSEALVIARASVLLGATRSGRKRAFGLAVKLFAGRDPERRVETVNFLVMDNMSGTRERYFVNAVLDNNPALGGLPAIRDWGAGLRLKADLSAADRESGADPPRLNYRPVSELAAPGLAVGKQARAPHWLRLSAAPGSPRIPADDFREQLRLRRYPQQRLVYLVEAAENAAGGKSKAVWQALGRLRLTASVTSPGCDARLHFAHPRIEQGIRRAEPN